MKMEIVDLEEGCLPIFHVPEEEQERTWTLTRPQPQRGAQYTIQSGGVMRKAPIGQLKRDHPNSAYKLDETIVQMLWLDSDTLQFILRIMDPKSLFKVEHLLIVKKKCCTFGMMNPNGTPFAREPCEVGVLVTYADDETTRDGLNDLEELTEGWMNRHERQHIEANT